MKRLYKAIRLYLIFRKEFRNKTFRGPNYTWRVPLRMAWRQSRL
jgi:hypothetical protein